MRTRTGLLVMLSIALAPVFAYAQASDGSTGTSVPPDPSATTAAQDPVPVSGGSAAQAPAPAPAPASASQSTPQSTPAQPAAGSAQAVPPPAATSGSAITPRPGTPGNPAPSGSAPTTVANPDSTLVVPNAFPTITASGTPAAPRGSFPWLVVAAVLAVLAVIPFGFVIAGRMKKKSEDSDERQNRCFDIKQMMEDKLKELTDVQAMMKEHAIEKGKELLRDSVSGTATGDLLVRAEKLEEQYKKLKALYEECTIDADHYAYKGVLVENSLLDKTILTHLRVIRTRTEQDRVLHDIRISKSQIEDIQHDMIDTKWYFHLWEPGKDAVTVVFKDAIFTVQNSDTATWREAIAHGVQCGIPESEMNFSIDR